MKNSLLAAVGALLVGGVAGYLVGASGGADEEAGADELRSGSKSSRTAARSSGAAVPSATRPAKARDLREVLEAPGQTNRIMGLLEYYAELDPSQFPSEMQRLQSLPMSQRMLAMNLLFARWAETDPHAALEESRTMGFPEMFMARAGVVSGWAASDPEGLARQYVANPDDFRMRGPGRGGADTVATIAGEWSKQNPSAALEWARSLEAGEAGEAIGGIFNELARKDPDEALRMAATLSGEERLDAYRSIAGTWAIADYAAADQWIDGLSGDERTTARQQAVEALAEIDPRKASGEALKLAEGEERDELIADVSREWAREDPSAALEYLVANGGEEAVSDGIGQVMGSLAGQDAGRAFEWIEAQPDGPVRDRAVQGYLFGNRDAEPAENIALAETISDEGERAEMVQRMAFQWLRDDSESALNYVESSTILSDEAKERFTTAAERMAEDGDRPGRRGPGGFRR